MVSSPGPATGRLGAVFLLALALAPVAGAFQTNVQGQITDATWDQNGSPYRLTGDAWIDGDHVLTIEPGVEVVFTGNYRLSVGRDLSGTAGTLLAQGTPAEPIEFLSETAGNKWVQVAFTAYATAISVLSDATLTDGKLVAGGLRGAIVCQGSSPSLSNLEFVDAAGVGIYLIQGVGQVGASPALSGTLTLSGASTDYLIDSNDSTSFATFSGCTLSSVGKLARGGADFWSELFDGATVVDAGSTARTAVVMTSPGLLDRTTTWDGSDLEAIHLEGGLTIRGDPLPALTLSPGTLVTLAEGTALHVGDAFGEGALIAVGAPGQRIGFEGPAGAHADGVVFGSNARGSVCRLEQCDLVRCGDSGAALSVTGSSPTLADVTVTDSATSGILFSGASSTASDLTVTTFADTGIEFTGIGDGVRLEGTNLVDGGPVGMRFTSSPHVSGLTIQNVTDAVVGTTQAVPTFDSVTIHLGSGDFGEAAADLWANLLNNATVTGTGVQRVLKDRTLTKSTTWGGVGMEVHLLGGAMVSALTVEGPDAPVLTIAAGTRVALDPAVGLSIGPLAPGGLVVAGTVDDPVVFDRRGAGAWRQLHFAPQAVDELCDVAYCELDGGGDAGLPILECNLSSPTLRNVTVTGGGKAGLHLEDSSATVSDLQVTGLDADSVGISFVRSSGASLSGTNTVSGGQTGVLFDRSSPSVEGLTVGGSMMSYALMSTATPPASVPSFAGITVQADAAKLGQGSADFWANFVNSSPTIVVTAKDRTLEVLKSDLTRSCTWGAAPLDHILLLGDVGVYGPLGPVLTIDAGAIVQVAVNKRLVVGATVGQSTADASGGLVVQGTETERVSFEGQSGAAWGPVRLEDAALPGQLALAYCDFRHMQEPVVIDGCEPVVADVGFYLSGDAAGDCALLVENLTDEHDLVLDTVFVDSPIDVGIRIAATAGNVSILDGVFVGGETAIECVAGGALTLVEGATFQDACHGLTVGSGVGLVVAQSSFTDWHTVGVDVASGSFPVVLETTFDGGGEALRVPAWAVDGLGQATSGNDFTEMSAGSWVAVRGDDVIEELRWEELDADVHYVVLGDVRYGQPMRFAPGVRVELDPGMVIAPSSGKKPAVIALGTQSSPVTFRARTRGQPWGQLYCGTGSSLEFVEVDEAGSGGAGAIPSLVVQGKATLRNVTVHNGLGDGLRQDPRTAGTVMASASVFDACAFTENQGHGLLCTEGTVVDAFACHMTDNGSDGVHVDDGSLVSLVSLRECRITGNSGMAVGTDVSGESNVDARYSWWGDPDGPGAGVGGSVDFDPWYATDLDVYAMTDAEVGPPEFVPTDSETRFYALAPADADWTLEVDDGQNIVFSDSGQGPLIDVAWNGESGGNPVSDGPYPFTLRAVDPSGAPESIVKGTVHVDSGLLVAEIATPDPLAFVYRGDDVVVTGTADGAAGVFDHYVLEYGIGNEPSTFVQFASSTAQVVDDELGTLSLPLPGADGVPYLTFRLRVVDQSQEEAVATRLVRYCNLYNLKAAPDPFTPDGDDFEDITYVSANITWSSTWSLTISTDIPTGPGPQGFGGLQGPIYVYDETEPGTHFSHAWDGMVQGTPVAADDYQVKLVATPVAGSGATIQATTSLTVTEDTPAIRIVAPAEGAVVAHHDATQTTVELATNIVDAPFTVDVDVGTPGNWRRIATLSDGSFRGGTASFSWDPVALPSLEQQIRATLYHVDGSVYHAQHEIVVANLIVDPLVRAFDPAAGEMVTFEVKSRETGTGPGAADRGDVTFSIYSAVTSLHPVTWKAEYEGRGATPLWQTAVEFTGVPVSIVWDGRDDRGSFVPAGEYVAVADVTYDGPVAATFEDPPLDPRRRNERLSALFMDVASFNPYLGERVEVAFDLSEASWVSMAQTRNGFNFGILPKQLYDGGSSVFSWDGRGYYWVRLGASAYPEDVLPGDDEMRAVEVMATEVPRSMVSTRNGSLSIDSVTVEPVTIFPRYGQIAHFELDVTGGPADVRAEVYVRDPSFDERFSTEVIGGLEMEVAEYVLEPDCAGRYCFDLDGLVEGVPIADEGVTVGVLLIAENPGEPSYRDVVKRLVRLQN